MVFFRTQHETQGVTDVSDGDEYRVTIGDEYRRVSGLDLAGDVERRVTVRTDDENRHGVFGDSETVRGEGDVPLDVDLTKGDELVIEYLGAGTVSDVWYIHTYPPLEEMMHKHLQREQNQ